VKRGLLGGAAVLALAVPGAAQAFTPNDPFVPRQWYATQDRAFDAFNVLPLLPQVRVAVIDSGVDSSHPDLKGRILAARSFVGGSPSDEQGHGTFVAGEIAAGIDDGRGIAGLAASPRLLIAKVVRSDGSVSIRAEARAIRWAVRHRARVINVSLGGLRDPQDPTYSGYSVVEAQAIAFAVKNGALVVAPVGNNNYAPVKPWNYAAYPAALPHVVGIGSYARSGDTSRFSNRDQLYVDLAAPGEDMFSLLPRVVTGKNQSCSEQGYSSCGPKEYKHAAGTSFSAPQVAAAAATLFGLRPSLTPDQVSWLLERNAVDATPENGCDDCPFGRDSLTGWGKLNIAAAVRSLRAGDQPPADRREPNDDIALGSAVNGRRVRVRATIDYWDDTVDVYRIKLRRGQRLSVVARAGSELDVSLVLWKPALTTLADASSAFRARRSIHGPGVPEKLHYRARKTGWYSLEVVAAKPGFGQYRLKIKRA
jgi:subtilisin family serine protease